MINFFWNPLINKHANFLLSYIILTEIIATSAF